MPLELAGPDYLPGLLVVVLPAFGEEPSAEGAVRVAVFAGGCPACLIGRQLTQVRLANQYGCGDGGELTLDELLRRSDRGGAFGLRTQVQAVAIRADGYVLGGQALCARIAFLWAQHTTDVVDTR